MNSDACGVTEAEAANDAVTGGLQSVSEPTAEVAKTTFWQRMWKWFKTAAKRVYEVVMPGVVAGVTAFLNDEDNQAAAVSAVKAAIDGGLRGDQAWAAARDVLCDQLAKSGKEASDTMLDTILQNAYCAVKYSVAKQAD